MYRQVYINEKQLDLQRILWRQGRDQPLKVYRLKTVTYGTAAAPFLAIRTLHQLATDERSTYPIASSIALSDFYVDDLMTGAKTLEDAKVIQTQMSQMLNSGGFNLRKWNSNSKELLETIPDKNRAKQEQNKQYKVLGMWWNSETDMFHYASTERKPHDKISKRSVLSEIASLFDPLGLVGPVVLKFKLFMQELWVRDVSWDESLPCDLHTSWQTHRQQLSTLKQLQIQRHITVGHAIQKEIHGFCDASERAYGACVYIRTTDTDGRVSTQLLCSKSRVSPLQKMTIPRLELCAALLLSKLVTKVLDTGIKVDGYTLWTDSSIVLAWITSSASKWKTYVANRVKIIQELTTERCSWRHVRTNDNPADLISRGLNPIQIIDNKLWWHGPEWLIQNSSEWPKFDLSRISDVPEQKLIPTTLAVVSTEPLIDVAKYSSLSKLTRVTAYCLRFISNLKNSHHKLTGPLTTEELNHATNHLIRAEQEHYMREDYNRLMEGKKIRKDSPLWNLQSFFGPEKLIRVGGRLKHAEIKIDQKHPIVLPYKSHLTELIFRHEHIRLLHAAPQLLLASLRQRYWPLNGRNLARRTIHSCVKCFKANPKTTQPQMGVLPSDRVRPCRPFSNTGTDISGPVYIKASKRRNSPTSKGYIVIFVCLATKAVHLEVVTDMTSEAFIAAFKRFISRRGIVTNMYSDNGTNFVGAERELRELQDLFTNEEHQRRIVEESTAHLIKWHFIPPRSPHFGGLWEAAVRSVKHHLKRVVANASLTFEEFYTTLTMIEACLNSRPLTPLSTDPNDLSPLTPGHFLTGDALTALPEPNICYIQLNRLSHWQGTQQIAQHFWTRWSKEYLSLLQQRPKWRSEAANIQLNQLVLLKEDNLPPLKWVTGRVVAVHPGADNRIRVATVKTSSGTFRRAVNKLCILPLEPNTVQEYFTGDIPNIYDKVAWRYGVLVLRAWEATELSLPLLEVAFHEPRDVTPRFMVGSLQGGRGWPSRLVGARKNLYLGQGPRTSLLYPGTREWISRAGNFGFSGDRRKLNIAKLGCEGYSTLPVASVTGRMLC
ncbi:uncharacterized protein LOC124358342 [Homalodisca vitripennis]|uniref:uncharacterized protein LOC124358342 n=1 Tax=Homalodisca vitripennis TaxID=197043 RepID=UPI001EE9C54C|nr:uncharacterized protein LOC124358342 [Homalodisca vitripennis]